MQLNDLMERLDKVYNRIMVGLKLYNIATFNKAIFSL